MQHWAKMGYCMEKLTLSANPHKMVKHTQKLPNCFSVFDHFVWLALK